MVVCVSNVIDTPACIFCLFLFSSSSIAPWLLASSHTYVLDLSHLCSYSSHVHTSQSVCTSSSFPPSTLPHGRRASSYLKRLMDRSSSSFSLLLLCLTAAAPPCPTAAPSSPSAPRTPRAKPCGPRCPTLGGAWPRERAKRWCDGRRRSAGAPVLGEGEGKGERGAMMSSLRLTVDRMAPRAPKGDALGD